jgi:signal peptidase I
MKRKSKPRLKQYAITIGIALIVGILLRTYVVQAYRIPSRSMQDTLLHGDFLLVDKLTYRFSEPQVGDVIVFQYPLNPTKDFIKRIIATEGQRVELVNKRLYVDGQSAEDWFPSKHTDYQIFPAAYSNRDNFGPFQVPSDQFFVMGDNRDNSQDSRQWGFLERKHIKGKALLIYFSWAPDAEAPQLSGPLSFFEVLAYNLTHFPWRIRWGRVGTIIR